MGGAGRGAGVVEKAVDLEREISVLVARSPTGEVKVYPPAWNHHENQILAWSVMPAPISDAMEAEARQSRKRSQTRFNSKAYWRSRCSARPTDRLLVNELAPRPHNSYHASERACERASSSNWCVRCAICRWAMLTSCSRRRLRICWAICGSTMPAAARAALRQGPGGPRSQAAPLREASKPRKGRKMGHLSAVGPTAEEAVELVLRARRF